MKHAPISGTMGASKNSSVSVNLGSMGNKCINKAHPKTKSAPGPNASSFGKTGTGKSV